MYHFPDTNVPFSLPLISATTEEALNDCSRVRSESWRDFYPDEEGLRSRRRKKRPIGVSIPARWGRDMKAEAFHAKKQTFRDLTFAIA
jgi:hypothetical protein